MHDKCGCICTQFDRPVDQCDVKTRMLLGGPVEDLQSVQLAVQPRQTKCGEGNRAVVGAGPYAGIVKQRMFCGARKEFTERGR